MLRCWPPLPNDARTRDSRTMALQLRTSWRQTPQLLTYFLLAVGTYSVGCRISLPPPTIHESLAPSNISWAQLCGDRIRRVQFSINDSEPLIGIIECEASKVTTVLVTNFNVRVRTITMSPSGAIRDENSYLAPSTAPPEHVLSEVIRAFTTPTTRTDTGFKILTIERS